MKSPPNPRRISPELRPGLQAEIAPDATRPRKVSNSLVGSWRPPSGTEPTAETVASPGRFSVIQLSMRSHQPYSRCAYAP